MSHRSAPQPTLATSRRLLSFLLVSSLALTVTASVAVAQDGGLPVPQQTMKKGDGWLGVGLKTIPLEDAKKRGFQHELVLVDNVFKGSPAFASGFEVGDIILKYNGTLIQEVKTLVELVRGTAPGTRVEFVVVRGKKQLKKPLLLALRPDRLEMVRAQLINQPAPDFAISRVDAKGTVKLSENRGKVMVVDFWATWCGPCRRSIPHMNDLTKAHGKDGLVVVGISDEDPATIKTFAKKTPMQYALATDPERTTNRDYMVSALPTLFIIDHKGVIREVVIGGGQFDAVDKAVKKLLAERDADLKKK